MAGKGSKGRGGDPGGFYWHIFYGERRAGHIYINLQEDATGWNAAFINIQVNAACQNRGIGTAAYALAAKASGYDVVYAQMRKSNVMSRRAAEHAGFKVVDRPEERQLLMMWSQ